MPWVSDPLSRHGKPVPGQRHFVFSHRARFRAEPLHM